MICVTCQWLWENLDRPGEKSIRARQLVRRGRYSFPEEEKEDHHFVCGSHDGHRIGENGQAEFGNVARLSIFLRMI